MEKLVGADSKCPECGAFAWVKDLKTNRQLANTVSMCTKIRMLVGLDDNDEGDDDDDDEDNNVKYNTDSNNKTGNNAEVSKIAGSRRKSPLRVFTRLRSAGLFL